jgi:hypothetical protein
MDPTNTADYFLDRADKILKLGPCPITICNPWLIAKHLDDIVSPDGDILKSSFVVEEETPGNFVVYYRNDGVDFMFAKGINVSGLEDVICRTTTLIETQKELVMHFVNIRGTKFANELTTEIIEMLAKINEFFGFENKPESLAKADETIRTGNFGTVIKTAVFESILIATIMTGMVHDDDRQTIVTKAVQWRNHFSTDSPDEYFLNLVNDTLMYGGQIEFFLERAKINATCLFDDSDDAALLIVCHLWLCDCFNALQDKYSRNTNDVISTIGGL